MGLFDLFKPKSPDAKAAEQESQRRQADILMSLRSGRIPTGACSAYRRLPPAQNRGWRLSHRRNCRSCARTG